MKSSIIIASACATLALANPVVRREIKTEVVYEYVTVTVVGTGPSPTSVAPVAVPTSDAPVVAPTSDAPTSDAATSAAAPASDSANQPGAFFSAAPSSQPAAPAVDTSGLSDYAKPILEQHNIHRSNHSVGALQWDDYLVNAATLLANSCIYGHNTAVGGGGYGQNIGAGQGPSAVPGMITNGMYNLEMDNYHAYGGEPDNSQLGSWGHFTQIVWKGTTKVGCATATCPTMKDQDGKSLSYGYFTVCNYSPPGNYRGEYGANVLAPKGQAVVTV